MQIWVPKLSQALSLPQLERLAGWPCVPTYDDSHRSFGKGDESVKFSRAQHDALVDANA